MSKTALITGASSGIGAEFARVHASQQGNLVLVARRSAELNQLKQELEGKYNIEVMVLTADLLEPDAPEKIFNATQAAGIQVDYLINNAGFGGHGKFHTRELAEEQAMVQLNITALISLTHLYLQEMTARNSGKILNVASTAGFLPGPLQAVYYATKSFVLSFSEAIAQELGRTNITCTALCPGPVATEFAERADLEGVNAFKKTATPAKVAKLGYEAMLKGELVKIDNPFLSFQLNWLVPLLPRKLKLKISHGTMLKS